MGDIKSIKWVRRSNLSSKEKTRVRTLANAHNSHEAQIRMNNHNLKYMRKEKIAMKWKRPLISQNKSLKNKQGYLKKQISKLKTKGKKA